MAKKIEVGVRNVDINTKLVEEILFQSNPNELFGKDGLFQELKKKVVERILE